MARKSYKGNAVATKLANSINSGALSIQVSAATGWPDGVTPAYPFVLTLARGQANEEKVLCDSRSGTTITVNASGRGFDGTSASAHVPGEDVEHTIDADTLTTLAAHAYGTGTDHSGLALSSHTHALSYGTPVAVGSANAAGVDTSLSRRDHVHQGARIVCTSGTRPGAPFTGLEIYETDTKKVYIWRDAAWFFVGSPTRTTGFECAFTTGVTVSGVFTSLAWTESFDSDNFLTSPSVNITVPTGLAGVYVITAYVAWASTITQVNLIDIVPSVGGRYQGLGTGTGEATVSAGIYLPDAATVHVEVAQTSGGVQNISSAWLAGYRLST